MELLVTRFAGLRLVGVVDLFDALRTLQLTHRKSEYIREVARQMADGALDKADLSRLEGRADVLAALVSIRGIGPWTAHYVAMRCLRA